jgi:arabinogalactan oligomer / maltooligosaccharide transport system substrate-binding protein
MKKTVLFSMAVLVILSMVLSACASAATPATQAPVTKPVVVTPVPSAEVPTVPPTAVPTAAPVKLTMWTREGGITLDLLKAIVADFVKANPDITVDIVNYDVEHLRENFQTSMLAGAGASPDLLWTVNDHAGPFTTADLIQPVDNLGIDLKQFVPGALEPVKLNGQYWGIPLSFGNNLMLMYNKKLIDKAPADTDEMVQMAKDFMAKNPGKYGLVFNAPEPFFMVPWLGGYGGKVFADDGKTPTLDTEAMVKTLTLVSNFKDVDKIMPAECDYNIADNLFIDGKAAMIFTGDWALAGYAGSGATVTATQNIELGTAPYPKITGADFPKPYTSGQYIMFPKGLAPDKLAAALKLTNYFISDAVEMRWLTEQKRLPSVQKLFDDPAIKSDPILAGSAADLLNGTGMPAATEMRCNWDAIRPSLSDVLTGKATPADAAKAMQTAAEKCVADLK